MSTEQARTPSPVRGGRDSRRVLAVVPNWNGLDFTRACCASLRTQTHAPLAVLVVDNGSTAHTAGDLQEQCPGVNVLALPENRGFSGGVNAGLKTARWQAYDYVWLLNNDTVCDSDALGRLLDRAEADTAVAAVGCALRETIRADSTGPVVPAGKWLRPPFYIPHAARGTVEPDYLCGACLLIRREALEAVGLLDEGFFFYFEDADWCFRVRRAGWRLATAAGSPIFHAGGGTIRRQSAGRARFYRAGHVRFLRRQARHPLLVSLPPAVWRVAVDLIRGNWAGIRGSVAGFWTGWRDTRP